MRFRQSGVLWALVLGCSAEEAVSGVLADSAGGDSDSPSADVGEPPGSDVSDEELPSPEADVPQGEPDVVAVEDVPAHDVTAEDVPAVPDVPAAPDVEEVPDVGVEDIEPTPDVAPETPDVPVVPDVPDAGPPFTCTASLAITAPSSSDFYAVAEAVTLSANVTLPAGELPGDYIVEWSLGGGPLIGQSPIGGDGSSSWTGLIGEPGLSTLTAIVVHSNGTPCEGGLAESPVRLCAEKVSENFDTGLDAAVWLTASDAYWDPGGWLEMTGLFQGRKGAIYSTQPQVAPGSVSIRFRFSTGGGGDSNGADGFAATFMKADSLADMQSWIVAGEGGGGLGYGAGGPYGAFTGDAFTVEIDTWQNILNGAEYHSDPTGADHIELTQGLDPSASIAYYDIGNVEDLSWHSVRVDIAATHIKVWYDGAVVVDTEVPDFEFRGGYVFFSGSTGYYYNYHRFDDLTILHDCDK